MIDLNDLYVQLAESRPAWEGPRYFGKVKKKCCLEHLNKGGSFSFTEAELKVHESVEAVSVCKHYAKARAKARNAKYVIQEGVRRPKEKAYQALVAMDEGQADDALKIMKQVLAMPDGEHWKPMYEMVRKENVTDIDAARAMHSKRGGVLCIDGDSYLVTSLAVACKRRGFDYKSAKYGAAMAIGGWDETSEACRNWGV